MNRHQKHYFWGLAILLGLLAAWLGAGPATAGGPPLQVSAEPSLLGKEIFAAKCVECHGREGKGDGPAATFLNPRPRDLTSGKYKFRTTESGSIPTDEDIRLSILNGLHGTSMPDWKPFLTGDSLQALVGYVKSLSPRFASEKPKSVTPGTPVPASPASIAAGKKVYENLECASCHGTDGGGKDAIASDMVDDWGHSIDPVNMTEPWTFRRGPLPEEVYLRLLTGVDGSPMPSYKGSATEKDLRNLANYVASLGRKPVWEMSTEDLKAHYERSDEAARRDPVKRGKYLVASIGCAFCHTPTREDGSMVEEMLFAGGQRWDLYPFDNLVSYNLTSDKETGLGGWTDDELKTLLTKGIRRDGSRMIPYPMPWPSFALMKEEDLNAIVAYLRTIPPVYNKIPAPESPNIFSYLWGKFQVLILKKDLPVRVFAGNAGSTAQSPVSAKDQRGKEAQP